MDIQINTYDNFKKPKVVSTINLLEWLSKIKQESTHSGTIIQARHNPELYDTIKGNTPCVTYNFQYNRYKKDENIIQSTGVIYIDIDTPEFNVNILDKDKVCSYYHSFGGIGYAILVKVSGVTYENFNVTYNHVVRDLGLEDYVDTQAIKPSQLNVLSHDKNIFINQRSFIYTGIPALPSMVYKYNKKNTYTIDGVAVSNIRFDNLDEIEINGDYVVNWDGYGYIRCFIPIKKIQKGNRNKSLITYCNNLVYLNPNISFERTLRIMHAVNERMCEIPVDDSQLNGIVQSVFKYLNDGSLSPIYYNKKRKIVFNSNVNLSRDEKLEICRKEMAQYRRGLSEQKIYDIIENWDFDKYGKITQRSIFLNHPVSKKTIGKYWSVFRVLVDEMNRGGN